MNEKQVKIIGNLFQTIGEACINAGSEFVTALEVPTTEKKVAKKKVSKKISEEKEAKKFFSKDDPAKTPKELKLFHEHWNVMTAEQQEQYLRGEISSDLNSLKEEENIDKEELEELENVGEKTYTINEVRDVARACAKKIGKEGTYQILENFGSNRVAEIDPLKFKELIKKLGEC
jgi:hypothetical protein